MIQSVDRRIAGSVTLVVAILSGSAQGQEVPEPRLGSQLPQIPRVEQAVRPPTFVDLTNRVYQRDEHDKADIPLTLSDSDKDVKITGVRLENGPGGVFRKNKIVGVPTGGPYMAIVSFERKGESDEVAFGPIFVGDIWVLAGQSNMQGVGDLADVTPPHELVMLLGMDGKWNQAEEPLHWLLDSPDPVHSGDQATRQARAAQEHETRSKGAGLGLPFATFMANNTGVPVGLVACAHGGTSMEQWNPAKKGDGGNSLYGSMLRQVKLAGGKLKGVLWYQGEAEANPPNSQSFTKKFTDFIAAVRSDFDQPDLPFYYVQIGRFVHAADPASWNKVQDIQRKLPETIANTAVVAALDLELDDGIHVGTQGLKRIGTRLGKIALREVFGRAGATTPTFDRVSKGPGNTIVVKFKNVNMKAEDNSNEADAVPLMVSVGGGQPPVPMYARFGSSHAGSDPAAQSVSGLRPVRHIAGFSLRKADGTDFPLIYEAKVGTTKDSVALKLNGKLPDNEPLFLWYGWGYDPYCNLVDSADIAVPMFGPISLEGIK